MLHLDTSNRFALTMLTVHIKFWLIENQSRVPNKSRNAMVLPYDLLIYSEVIREIMHLYFLLVITKKSAAG